MAAQGFLARVAGRTKQLFGAQTSVGAGDAGKIVALDNTGKIDPSMLPSAISGNIITATASEGLNAGSFVNLWNDAGTLKLRLADNSNGREAWGYVTAAVLSGAVGSAQRLNTVNASLSGLTSGADYWLGIAGGLTNTALDPATDVGKLDQYLGKAQSATELVTAEFEPVTL